VAKLDRKTAVRVSDVANLTVPVLRSSNNASSDSKRLWLESDTSHVTRVGRDSAVILVYVETVDAANHTLAERSASLSVVRSGDKDGVLKQTVHVGRRNDDCAASGANLTGAKTFSKVSNSVSVEVGSSRNLCVGNVSSDGEAKCVLDHLVNKSSNGWLDVELDEVEVGVAALKVSEAHSNTLILVKSNREVSEVSVSSNTVSGVGEIDNARVSCVTSANNVTTLRNSRSEVGGESLERQSLRDKRVEGQLSESVHVHGGGSISHSLCVVLLCV